jgi:hypothetical protein
MFVDPDQRFRRWKANALGKNTDLSVDIEMPSTAT